MVSEKNKYANDFSSLDFFLTALRILFLLTLAFLFVPQLSAHSRSAFSKIQNNQKAITYSFSGGRFGDNLLAYLHAKWLSKKYNLPFVYVPFPYSDQLMLHQHEELFLDFHLPFFKKKWVLKNESDIAKISGSSLIFVPYFPEAEIELKTQSETRTLPFKVDWKNPEFKEMIRKLITPRFTMSTIEIPQKPLLSVAVHVRRGGDFESFLTGLDFPLKFPPDTFYIAAIRKMSELFSHQELYIYIFTDDPDPQLIVNTYKNALNNPLHIHLDCRKTCDPTEEVLEDFFSILKFDCLIRPESNYTIVAEKLKDFMIVISPKDHRIEDGVIYIETLHIKQEFSLVEQMASLQE